MALRVLNHQDLAYVFCRDAGGLEAEDIQRLVQVSRGVRHCAVVVELLAQLCVELHATKRSLGLIVWASKLLHKVGAPEERTRRAEHFLTTVTLAMPNTQVFTALDAVSVRMRSVAVRHIHGAGVVPLLLEVLRSDACSEVAIDRILTCLQQCVISVGHGPETIVPFDLLDVLACDDLVLGLLDVYCERIMGRTVQELIACHLLVQLSTAVTAARVAHILFERFMDLLNTGSELALCPYLQMLLLRLFSRHHGSPPFTMAFVSVCVPVDRVLVLLRHVAEDPTRHVDTALPALLVFEGLVTLLVSEPWYDHVVLQQALGVLHALSQRGFGMLRDTLLATTRHLVHAYRGRMARAACVSVLGILEDAGPAGWPLLDAVVLRFGGDITSAMLWAHVVRIVQRALGVPGVAEAAVSILRHGVRKCHYDAVVGMLECLPAVRLVLDRNALARRARPGALELLRIIGLRLLEAERPAFIAALRASGALAAVLAHTEQCIGQAPCVREARLTLALLVTLMQQQALPRTTAAECILALALACWQHPRATSAFRTTLVHNMLTALCALEACEKGFALADLARIAHTVGTCRTGNAALRTRAFDLYAYLLRVYTLRHPGGIDDLPWTAVEVMLGACLPVFAAPADHSYPAFCRALHLVTRLAGRAHRGPPLPFPTAGAIAAAQAHFAQYTMCDPAVQRAITLALAHTTVLAGQSTV